MKEKQLKELVNILYNNFYHIFPGSKFIEKYTVHINNKLYFNGTDYIDNYNLNNDMLYIKLSIYMDEKIARIAYGDIPLIIKYELTKQQQIEFICSKYKITYLASIDYKTANGNIFKYAFNNEE